MPKLRHPSQASLIYVVATVGDHTPVVQLTPPTSEVFHVTVMSDAFRRGLRVKKPIFRSQMPLGTFEGMEIKPGGT